MTDLVNRLHERAKSYRQGGPSSEHTAVMLEEAASRISQQDAELERLRRELEEAKEFRAILEGHLSAAIDDYNEARKVIFTEAVEIALVFAGKHEPSYGLVNREIHEAILAVVGALRAKAEETGREA